MYDNKYLVVTLGSLSDRLNNQCPFLHPPYIENDILESIFSA